MPYPKLISIFGDSDSSSYATLISSVTLDISVVFLANKFFSLNEQSGMQELAGPFLL